MSWYTQCGKDGDVILSSRVRLARDLEGYAFPHGMTNDKKMEARDRIVDAITAMPSVRSEKFVTLNMDLLPEPDRFALVEKHLISEDLSKGGPGLGVCISKDESVSIMINEEDHIRIQVMDCGFSLDRAYRKAEEIAVFLENHLPVAFSDQYGFLTACPTNTGTGMRASVMVHLPALTMLGRMQPMIDGLSQAGFTVRGYLGEHSMSTGNLYQLSNRITLGITEKNVLLSFKRMVEEVLDLERKLRKELFDSNPDKIRDMVYRSYGELLYARMMTDTEAMKRISDLRLGIALGFFSEQNEETLSRLAAFIGPAGVQKDKGEVLSVRLQEIHRAEMIRRILSDPSSR
ncbi:MAG: protein arginine kinase [Clostridiaceae bacterium]|nr:protein arginine kinase [Clostridiaceae bacterium]